MKRVLAATVTYGFASVAAKIVGVVLLPVYTRFLSPTDYGVLETLNTTISLVSVMLLLGMDNAFFRFAFDDDSPSVRSRVYSTTFMYSLGVALLGIGLLVPNRQRAAVLLFGNSEAQALIGIAFVSGSLLTLLSPAMNVFRIHEKPIPYASLSLAQLLIAASLNILLVVVLRFGVMGVMIGSLASASAVTLAALLMNRRWLRWEFSWSLLLRMLKYGLPIVPASLSLWVVNLADRYFLLHYSTPTEVGLYSVAVRFASVVGLVVSAFQMAWPAFAFSFTHQADRNQIYARVLSYYTFVTVFVALAIGLFGKDLVTLLTAPAYVDAYKAIGVLSFALVANGVYSIFSIGINLKKRTLSLLPVTGGAAVTNLILNYLLIPRYGMIGAAWATFISYWLMAALMWKASEKVYHVQWEWARILKVLLVALVLWQLGDLLAETTSWESVATKTILLTGYLPLLLAVNCFKDDEKRAMKQQLLKVAKRIVAE